MKKVDQNKKISIIIPVYNAEKYLDRCLASVTGQSYRNIEIFLVNDGSDDGSANICRQWQGRDKRIVYLEQSNRGVSAARNAALKQVGGYYVSFIDADDWLEEDYLSYLVYLLQVYCGEIAVCSFVKTWDEKVIMEQPPERIQLFTSVAAERELTALEGSLSGYLWNKLFLWNIVKEIAFEEGIYCQEDELFFHQALLRCTGVVVSNQKKYFYFQHSLSALHGEYSERKFSALTALDIIRESIMDEENLDGFEEKYMTNLLSHAVDAVRLSDKRQRLYWLGVLHAKAKDRERSIRVVRNKTIRWRMQILVYSQKIFCWVERGIWRCRRGREP